MAVIKYGSIVTSGSGSLGGSTLQPGRSGNILRNKPQQTYSRTPAQALIRGYNKTMQAGWRSISDPERTIWNNFAKEKPVFNRSGEKHSISGHSLWMKYQYAYVSIDFSFQTDVFKAAAGPLGPELIKNGDFDDASNWLLNPADYVLNGELYAVGDPLLRKYVRQLHVWSVVPQYYRVQIDARNIVGTVTWGKGDATWETLLDGFNTYIFHWQFGTDSFYLNTSAASSAIINSISAKSIL